MYAMSYFVKLHEAEQYQNSVDVKMHCLGQLFAIRMDMTLALTLL